MSVEAAQSERTIRVLVADDSAVMRSAIRQMLEFDPAIRVVAVAREGLNALQMIVEHDPDVVTLDLEMPVMNGLQALERIMRDHPRPVILFSAMTTEGAEATLDGLTLGAFDYLGKPTASSVVIARDELIAKVKAAFASRNAAGRAGTAPPIRRSRGLPKSRVLPSLICIGSSTGGPAALQRILPKLPADSRFLC